MKPQIGFSANVGDKSLGLGGPDQLEADFAQIAKMFDPNTTHENNTAGGIATENMQLGAATDAIVGNRTVDQSVSIAFSNTGTLSQILSWIVKVLKSITGNANWFDVPAKTLEQLNTDKVETSVFATHKTSADHDSRYYTETEVNSMISSINAQLGASIVSIDTLNAQYANLNSLYSTDAERIAAINAVVEDLDTAEGTLAGLVATVGLKANTADVYTKTVVDALVASIMSSEGARVSAESDRTAAEIIRIASEDARLAAEPIRISNEAGRVSAEDARVISEAARDIVVATKLPINAGTLESYTEKKATNAAATGTVTLDLAAQNIFDLTLTGITAIDFSNIPASGKSCSVTVLIRQGATPYAVTYPAGVKWPNDVIPDISTASKTSILTFVTVDGGARWYGFLAGNKFTT